MFLAQEKSRSEYLKLTQEKEQQESLALEELELQKKAILSENENKLQELGREAEAYRTVSSCAVWAPEPGTMMSMGLSLQLGKWVSMGNVPGVLGKWVSIGLSLQLGKRVSMGTILSR